ncbi:MAG: purine-nucleoside phosphorylase [Pararhodobacter sp.]|nr:purine-nucleoside phosphorylase [Pararhodobacter sp.]
MTIHLSAAPGEIAETVLMPGDPLRARWAAERFLQDPVQTNRTRGMLGFTGRWRGERVTIQASGMGMASMAIYARELIVDYGARRLIRIGSAGSLQPEVGLRDLVLAQACTTLSLPSRPILREVALAPCADFALLAAAHRIANARGWPTHAGNVFTSDLFYEERDDLRAIMQRHGVLAVEMEAAELYATAARHGAQALAVLTISDHLPTGEALSPEERETGFAMMVELALETAFA